MQSMGVEKKTHDLENEYRERNRNAAILKREAAWQEKSAQYIQTILNENSY